MAEERVWKPLELIKVTSEYLTGKDVPNARLDAEVLLCEILGLPRRVDLYAGFEREISGKELTAYRELIRRRAAREPVSRILGRREFMGIPFLVTPDVLSPRPETELLVETALEWIRPKKTAVPAEPETETQPADEAETAPQLSDDEMARILDSYAEDAADGDDLDSEVVIRAASPAPAGRNAPKTAVKKKVLQEDQTAVSILDLGTGSGCIAVSLAAQLPAARVTAADASPKALAAAKKNAEKAGVADRIDFRRGDWFAACRDDERFDVIVSNPPYLVEGDPDIWPEVSRYDPPAALYGGPDGLDCYRRLVPDAAAWLRPGGALFLEVGAGQAKRTADLLRTTGFENIRVIKDYGGIERVVTGIAP